MSRSHLPVPAQLRAAFEAGDEVNVRRRVTTGEKVNGFIVGLSEAWALLASLSDDARLDGFTALRVQDIRVLERRTAARSITARVLMLDGNWPVPAPAGVDLTSAQALIQTASDTFGLVGVSYEDATDDALFIGAPLRITKRNRLELQTVDSQAVWEPRWMSWPLRHITRVDFDTAYMHALLRLAGPPPTGV